MLVWLIIAILCVALPLWAQARWGLASVLFAMVSAIYLCPQLVSFAAMTSASGSDLSTPTSGLYAQVAMSVYLLQFSILTGMLALLVWGHERIGVVQMPRARLAAFWTINVALLLTYLVTAFLRLRLEIENAFYIAYRGTVVRALETGLAVLIYLAVAFLVFLFVAALCARYWNWLRR